ncbi:MAG: hypothetical protein ACI8Q6_000571, partial [Granulosicoccus sp.]
PMNTREDFWARRKAGVAAEQEAEIAVDVAEQDAIALAEQEAKDDAEILAELNLPDPDTLKLGDEISGFMSKAVPDRLRRRALRRFWPLNPLLANVDGLVDYGEDFTDAACVIENMQTTYQVGKGMLYHVQEMERQEAAAAEANPVEEPEIEEVEPELVAALDPADLDTGERWHPTETDNNTEDDPETYDTANYDTNPAPRRMRFEFQG